MCIKNNVIKLILLIVGALSVELCKPITVKYTFKIAFKFQLSCK